MFSAVAGVRANNPKLHIFMAKLNGIVLKIRCQRVFFVKLHHIVRYFIGGV
jgi:hypothetical protein